MTRRALMGERAAVASTPRQRDRPTASSSRLLRFAAAHQHWTAAAIFALLALIYLWPALVGGQLFLPSSGLYVVTPWQSVVPSDIADYYNPSLVDVPASYYPWNVLARELLHAGTFPAWNPYAFGGTPFFANPEVAWLSPFSWLLWTLPLNYGLGVSAALKLWIAGFGMYLLIRELRLGFWAGVVAGISFAFCTFNVVWLSYGVHAAVAVLLPWAIWLTERVVRRGRSVDGLALAGIVALILTGGHPGTQLHVLSALVLYALMRAALIREADGDADVDRRDRLRRLAVIGAALVLGVLLTASTLLPAQQAAIDTAGAVARRDGSAGFPGSKLSFGALRAVLFPDWWGRPSEAFVSGPANYSERALFAGGVAFALAAIALVSAGGWRRKGPFVVLALIGLAVGLRAPVIRDAVVNAPLFDLVQNQRILLWFLFAVAVLAAFGLQAVLDGTVSRARAWGVVAAGAVVAAIAVFTTDTASGAFGDAVHYLVHRSGTIVQGVLPLASVGWFVVPLAAFAAILAVATRRPERRALVGGLTCLLVALEMLHFAHGFQPIGREDGIVPPRTPAVAFLQEHKGEGRIAGVGYSISNDWTTLYGLRDARGYDAPQPSLRFHALWTSMSPEQTTHTAYAFPALSEESIRVLSVLGTRYILDEPGTALQTPGLSRVYRGADATVYANARAMGRAIVAGRVHVAGETQEEVAAVMDPAFDPQRDVVVRGDELPADAAADVTAAGGAGGAGGAGDVRVVSEQNARVTLRAALDRPGVVVLNDAWAPGWSVRVDGEPARALQADVVLRGVAVPAGEHEIVWSYRVPGLRLGLVLTAIGLVAVVAWAGVLLVRRRRARG